MQRAEDVKAQDAMPQPQPEQPPAQPSGTLVLARAARAYALFPCLNRHFVPGGAARAPCSWNGLECDQRRAAAGQDDEAVARELLATEAQQLAAEREAYLGMDRGDMMCTAVYWSCALQPRLRARCAALPEA